MTHPAFQVGVKVRLQTDNGWSAPGCVMARVGDRWRIFWPDENLFTYEFPSNLTPYEFDGQPQEVAA
jgi:hypothetical protein